MASTEQEKEADLKALQDEIYRDKVRRARAMTKEERFADVFELTDSVLNRMKIGAMWKLKTEDDELGWREVGAQIEQLRKVRDIGRMTNDDPRLNHER